MSNDIKIELSNEKLSFVDMLLKNIEDNHTSSWNSKGEVK